VGKLKTSGRQVHAPSTVSTRQRALRDPSRRGPSPHLHRILPSEPRRDNSWSSQQSAYRTSNSWPSLRPCRCLLIIALMIGFVTLSCFLGIFFTIHKEYGYGMGDAFTLAGYVVAVGALISTMFFAIHYPRCDCWTDVQYTTRDIEMRTASAQLLRI